MVKEKHFTLHWSLFAQENLKELYLYIKNDSPQNAVKVRAGIVMLAKSLTYFPLKYEE